MKVAFPQAPEPSEDVAERGRLLFAGPVDFVKGVVSMDGLPAPDRPEVCFAGRSNVGKSSLINALTGRKGIARASNTPGRTQEVNFFALAGRGYLVDLPGYGFAQAPVAVVQKWQALLKRYLAGRPNLRRAFALIDARHGVKPVDHEIMALLDRSAVPFQVIVTKADKIGAGTLAQTLAQIEGELQRHPAAFPQLVVTSSEKGEGVATLRAIIEGLVDG
ncbi:ribosome biogenesis GTP-binding protein YihA/YsxC [Paracoccus contaminans]|uniref:Probable GTP-binding protein EngB n=1 Tax=Paracoccus contaminans TaxID=1945662 RepID=A0A1W6CVA2_9RHOB|nr:ribosome biogenesis GTP-binding protein YihA/YsxC [Paracoccus contaminans]ARJ68813.1 YihA family ribosome biogenesis GTP-binding protein [Paracoccus contaminans]